MKVSMQFSGGKELAAALGQLSAAVTTRVVNEALRTGGERIREQMSSNAPRRAPQPDMADHIVMSTARKQEGESGAIAIGPERGFAYALPLEVGTMYHPAQPYARPAFDSERQAALADIGAALWVALASRGISRSRSMSVPVSSPGGGGLL